ncbi:hypothetical protein BDV93DRAFT_565937 [Ceratobasidium sp. AG-I]|nr:hypothetical protein BDV93DRAFT_565937 [Ceratobasidium sp. AG-I]
MEHLHVPYLKDGYRASNRKGWIRQIVRYNARRDIMHGYREFLEWMREAKRAAAESEANGLGNPDVDLDDYEEESDDEMASLEDDDKDRYQIGDEDEDKEDGDEDEDYEAEAEAEGDRFGGGDGGDVGGVEGDGEGVSPGGEWALQRGRVQERPEPQQRIRQTERSATDIALPNLDTNKHGFPFPYTPVPFYRVAKRAGITVTSIACVAEELGFPKFLQHLQQHPYYASRSIALNPNTTLSIWNSLTLRIPTSFYCPTEKKTRLHARLEVDGKETQWDPVFYVPTKSSGILSQPKVGSER